jgi:hypothetical protein
MVRTGLGISILPYLAVAVEAGSGKLSWSRIAGHTVIRETGWIYPKMTRLPRLVSEVLSAFDRIRGQLRLAP